MPITVVACTKDRRLLSIDVLKVDTSKLVHSVESEEQEIGLLKGYKASIRLKENYHPRYIQARRLPIHIFPNAKKLKKKKNDSAGYFGKGHSSEKRLGVTHSHTLKRSMGILEYAVIKKLASTTRYVRIRFPCRISYLPTPPLGKGMTQGQFLSGV